MKQNENGKKIKENIRNQMRRIGSWKSRSKRRKLTTGVCVIAVVVGAIGLSGGSDTEVIYKETTVKYGTLVKGVTESGSVDIGTVDQTFDLDMSALQRTDTSGSSSSGSTAGSSSGSGGFGGMSASGGGAQGGLDMFGQIFNMGGSSSGSNGDDSTPDRGRGSGLRGAAGVRGRSPVPAWKKTVSPIWKRNYSPT